jgi:hypothetical protein
LVPKRFVAVLLAVAAGGAPSIVGAQPPAERFGSGLRFLPRDTYAALRKADIPLAGPLPPAVDLSSGFPVSGTQGAQASCVGWAVAYGLRSYQERGEIGWPFSDHSRFSPAYIYNQVKLGGTCSGPAYFKDALTLAVTKGVASWDAFPYQEASCSAAPTAAVDQLAAPFRISGFGAVNTEQLGVLKNLLAGGKPILIGMIVDDDFRQLKRDGVYSAVSGVNPEGHAMVVVGYDNTKGAFKVLNSWGPGWATDGFGWIAYGVFSTPPSPVVEGYVVDDLVTAPRPVPGEIGPGMALGAPRTVLAEVVSMRVIGHGRRSVSHGTGNHHCSSNCQGEPTRTNYSVSLQAGPGRVLREPTLRCVSGPCPWSAVLYARLEDDSRRAVASWDVWAMPTTWELSAEEISFEPITTAVTRVAEGGLLRVPVATGDGAPTIKTTSLAGTPISFEVGTEPTGAALEFIGRKDEAGRTVYTYSVR